MHDFFAMISFKFGCMSCGITHAVFRMFTIMIKYLRLLYKSNTNVYNMGPLKKMKNKSKIKQRCDECSNVQFLHSQTWDWNGIGWCHKPQRS